MILDRKIQRDLLERLASVYPARAITTEWDAEIGDSPQRIASANLIYLQEHGLCDASLSGVVDSSGPKVNAAKATARGMDFLADDGGLGSILGVVTIKLHDDTIKALIERKILESELPAPEKKRFLDQLRELPGETTKHLVLKLVDLGLEKGPEAIATIGTYLARTSALG